MWSADVLSGGASARPREQVDPVGRASCAESGLSASWRLHLLMLVAGVALLGVAQALQSLNSALRTAGTAGAGESVDRVRTLLQQNVGLAALLVLVVSATGLLGAWIQYRWPVADHVSLKWKKRYGLLPPPAHRATLAKINLLIFGCIYGYAVVLAVVSTALAFLLVPGLYDPVPVASPTPSGRAVEVVQYGTFAAMALVTIAGLLFIGSMWWRDRTRLRKVEFWLDRGVPACLACGYPLQGLDSPACPECGTPIAREPQPAA